MRVESPRRRKPSTNLTPLVDVVFILLVFFMLASSFMEWRSINLNTPPHGGGAGGERALLVRLYPERRLDVNGEPVTMSQLVALIEDRMKESPETRVLVQPKADLPLQEVVTVLDYLSMAGARQVSLTH